MKKNLLALFALLFGLLMLPMPMAAAASPLDDAVQLTSSLTVVERIHGENDSSKLNRQDITHSWKNIAKNICTNAPPGFLEEGNYAVTQYADYYLEIAWSPATDASAKMIFIDRPDPEVEHYVTLRNSPSVRYMTITHEDGEFKCAQRQYPSGPHTSNADTTGSMQSQPFKSFFSTYPVEYPVGYEGLMIPSSQPKAKYVAMGDSFSSGEGNPPFEYGTANDGTNECHRSSNAYPRLLQNDSSLSLGATSFVACSGATTDTVLNGQWNEPAQIDALSSETEVVTLTIGGNDVGFKEFATACVLATCNYDSQAYSDMQSEIIFNLPGRIEDVLEEIDTSVSLSTQVYVVGYPHIAPAEMPTGMNSMCWPLNGGMQDNPDPSSNDGAAVRSIVSQLNGSIQATINNFGSTRVHFVNPNYPGSPFEGHDWCEQDRYFDVVTYNNVEYSFHPSNEGQAAYAEVLKEAMN